MQVSAFPSKFDAFLAGKYKLTSDEMAGFELFNAKGNCNSWHLDGRGSNLKPNQHDTGSSPIAHCFPILSTHRSSLFDSCLCSNPRGPLF